MDTRKNILEIKNMHTYFFTDNGVVKSVDGVDIELKEGSTLGIVGESGCKFHTRCPMCMERCKTEAPQKYQVGDDHFVYCHLYDTEEAKKNAKAAENAVIHQ